MKKFILSVLVFLCLAPCFSIGGKTDIKTIMTDFTEKFFACAKCETLSPLCAYLSLGFLMNMTDGQSSQEISNTLRSYNLDYFQYKNYYDFMTENEYFSSDNYIFAADMTDGRGKETYLQNWNIIDNDVKFSQLKNDFFRVRKSVPNLTQNDGYVRNFETVNVMSFDLTDFLAFSGKCENFFTDETGKKKKTDFAICSGHLRNTGEAYLFFVRKEALTVCLCLPKKKFSHENFMTDSDFLALLRKNDQRETVSAVSVPKFYLEEETDICSILTKMGVKSVFDSKTADFSSLLGKDSKSVPKILQKISVINLPDDKNLPKNKEKLLIFDRPFKVAVIYMDVPVIVGSVRKI